MKNALRILGKGLRNYWAQGFPLMLMNVVTVLLAAPVITLPPALAGLWNVGNQVADGKPAQWRDYSAGFRTYFSRSWGLALVHLLGFGITLVNVWIYVSGNQPFNVSEQIGSWLFLFFAVLGFVWFACQMYPLALLLEQTDQRLRVAWRNGVVLFMVQPGFTIGLSLLLFLIIAVSMVLPPLWLLATLAVLAVVCNQAVKYLLEPHREQLRAKEAEGASLEEGGTESHG